MLTRHSFLERMSKNLNYFLTIFISIFSIIQGQYGPEWLRDPTETLIATHVIFRHGARTPDKYCFQPFNITKDYWPEGIGQLTQKGKMDEYLIGTQLRQRYRNFLSDIFAPNITYARSTDYDRTKASLLLTLAGLFPPTPSQKWNPHLLWQPIPTQYKEVQDDMLMRYPTRCAKYYAVYKEEMNTSGVQNIIANKKMLLDYVRANLLDPLQVSNIFKFPIEELFAYYFCLNAMEDTGVPIPDWAKPIYPDALSQMAVLEYHLKASTDELVRYTGGMMFKKILNDSYDYINGRNKENFRQIYLYSGHEFNVALTLLAIDAFKPKVPNYGSYVVIELHKINGIYGFKFFYQNYEEQYPVVINMKHCEGFCPLNRFELFMQNRLAPNDLSCDI